MCVRYETDKKMIFKANCIKMGEERKVRDRMIHSDKVQLYRTETPFKEFCESDPKSRGGANQILPMFTRISGCENTIHVHLENLKKNMATRPREDFIWIEDNLELRFDPVDTQRAKTLYHELVEEAKCDLPAGASLSQQVRHGLVGAVAYYRQIYPSDTESMISNLGVKLVMWLQRYRISGVDLNQQKTSAPKVVFKGKPKKHEVCFLHALWLAGCDVMCVQARAAEDPLDAAPSYHAYSHWVKIEKESLNLPDLTYEELAKLSDSVVLIRVYDEAGQVAAGGSGVVINSSGYIITNFHVVVGGSRFGVVFENDPQEYGCDQIIKYHQDFDVALIRVHREVKSLTLSEAPTVRGQRVVAIGSPLGLFNTISDGIVSGYRSFEDVDMIQFTAPISSGSSGGALLNMKGELLGITTAGYSGQNLNLAVPSSYLKFFAGNFIK